MTKLLEMLIRHEALKLKPYRCSRGFLTIGVGRNLDNTGITKDEAVYLSKEMNRADLEKLVPKLKPYRLGNGKLAIGYGRLLDDGITKDEALYLLVNDVVRCRENLERDCSWFQKLSDNRQDVIISMAFNMGFRGLLGFKNVIAAIEKGDFATASQEMLKSYWQKQVGQRARDLAEIMKSDSYPSKLS